MRTEVAVCAQADSGDFNLDAESREDALIKVRSHVSIQIDDAGFVKEMPDVLPETFRFLFFDAVQTVGLV